MGKSTTILTVGSMLMMPYVLMVLIFEPPLQLFYKRLPPANNSSVYIPGGGFSGFWYHLGLFSDRNLVQDQDEYYCYSSGCLSVIVAHLNNTVDDTYQACSYIQQAWLDGNITRDELVPETIRQLMPPSEQLEAILPKLHILTSNFQDGAEVYRPTTYDELVDAIIKTTWIPTVTGSSFLTDDEVGYLDGGFSRHLHPKCKVNANVPVTMQTFIHSLNPGMSEDVAYGLYALGREESDKVLTIN